VRDLGLTLYGVPLPESHTLGADNLQLVFDQIYAKGSDDIYIVRDNFILAALFLK